MSGILTESKLGGMPLVKLGMRSLEATSRKIEAPDCLFTVTSKITGLVGQRLPVRLLQRPQAQRQKPIKVKGMFGNTSKQPRRGKRSGEVSIVFTELNDQIIRKLHNLSGKSAGFEVTICENSAGGIVYDLAIEIIELGQSIDGYGELSACLHYSYFEASEIYIG